MIGRKYWLAMAACLALAGSGRAVAARKSDVHDKAAVVAFFEEPF